MNHPPPAIPVVLTIAGSDCCSGAGLQADLKVFSSHGVHGLTAVTCVVSEVPCRVNRIHPVPADVVADQVHLLLETYPVSAVKTGMLYSGELIRLTAAALQHLPAADRPFLVVDPVMVATSGDPLITSDAIAAYREVLFPLATVITPNLDEAAALLGRPLSGTDLAAAAHELAGLVNCAVLLKGGHAGGDTATDILATGGETLVYSAPFLTGKGSHGTGCTFSAAIAAHLAHGLTLPEACRLAKEFITNAIRCSDTWVTPAGAVQALRQWK